MLKTVSCVALAVAVLIGPDQLASRTSKPSAPDVLLIVVDALRPDHMSLYGYGRPTTRRLDARRPRLRVFTDAVTQAAQTAPSIASVFTGVAPHVHGLQFDSVNQVFFPAAVPILPEPFDTLAERFRAAGYATVGIAANPWIDAEWGYGRGFDRFVGWRTVDPELPNDGRRLLDHLHGWLDAAPDAPRFVYAHFMDVHAPYRKGHETFVTREGTEVVFNGKRPVAPADLRYMTDLYDSDIVYVDALIDELFARLDASGRRWIAAVIGDHGDEFLEHGGIGHGTTLYEELVRVPVVFAGSRVVERYGRSAYPLQLTDVHDLLLGAAGLDQGPLLGLISSAVPEPKASADRLRTTEFLSTAALRRGNWKYIVKGQPFSEELYDLGKDPAERANVARTHERVARSFRDRASALWPKLFPRGARGSDEVFGEPE